MTLIQLINTDPSGAGQVNINQCKSVQSALSVFHIFNNQQRLARVHEGTTKRQHERTIAQWNDLSERATKRNCSYWQPETQNAGLQTH